VAKAILILHLIAIFVALILALPILKTGSFSTFYSTDPDVHYVSNSLSYLQSKVIAYNNHPGTPAIVLISIFLLPLRIYVELLKHSQFIDWSFLNINFVYYFIRLSHSVLLGSSVLLFLIAVYKFSKSLVTTCFTCLSLLVYTAFPYLATTISAEGTLFFVTCLWLLVFTFYMKSRSKTTSFLLVVISAVALATKFTSMPLTIASIILYVFVPKTTLKQKLEKIVQSSLIILLVFIFCTWPIRTTYSRMFQWLTYLATTTETHGGGTNAIFNLSSYLQSTTGLIARETWAALISVYSIVGIMLIIARKKHLPNIPLLILVGSTLVSMLIIAKYPLSYYQVVTYTLLVFLASFSFNLLPKVTQIALLVVLILPAVANVENSNNTILRAAKKTTALETYIREHPPRIVTLWVWGRSRDFSLLWTRDWASGHFSSQLTKYRPNLLELEPNFDFVNIDGRNRKPVFSVCWDQLYLPQASASDFVAKYPQKHLKTTALPETDDMALIESNHCLTKP